MLKIQISIQKVSGLLAPLEQVSGTFLWCPRAEDSPQPKAVFLRALSRTLAGCGPAVRTEESDSFGPVTMVLRVFSEAHAAVSGFTLLMMG